MRPSTINVAFNERDTKNIGKSRPLAFTHYKLLAKILTECMKPVLSQIIGTEQQGFIKGGYITGNLILVNKLINCCKEHDNEGYIILMDF